MGCTKKSKEAKEKYKATCLEKYGTEYPTQYANQAQVNKDKIQSTMLERYGATYPIFHSRCRMFTLPSGNEVRVQGYEDVAIKELLQTFDEAELDIGCKSIEHIIYQYNERERKYYPDIFVKPKNLIIEVKSKYTLEIDKEQNLEKIRAAKRNGFAALI